MLHRYLSAGLVAAAFFAGASALSARVTKIVIEHRESPAYTGKSFGKAGQYELLTGHFTGELDPADPLNKVITDIRLAPKNARGMAEYTATFAIARPIDMSKASGVLMYGVPNRGRGEPEPGPDGHISVVSGWQGDVIPRAGLQTIVVPVARNADGSAVTGPVMARFINTPPGANTMSLMNAVTVLSYQRPASLDTAKATLTFSHNDRETGVRIPSGDWAWADCAKTPFPGAPDPSKVCLKGGFDPALNYELIFTAKDPLVLGMGYAATRDLNSFLRYEEKDDAGAPNPLAHQIQYAVSIGVSQSGNFIRSYIHLGFNQDEKKRTVWDGVNPHIAVRQLSMNYRFAAAGGTALLYEPGSDGVLWWGDYADEVRGRPRASLLDRCRATNTCPKIVETFGGLEFWDLRASPDLVGTDGKTDIPLPSNVRRYYLPSTSHGGGRGGFSAEAPAPPSGCVLPANPNPQADTMRALRAELVDWVRKGAEPPSSSYPRLDRGQLVQATGAAMGFPKIPGSPSPDGVVNPFYDYDFGPTFSYNDMSGVISVVPPRVKRTLPTLVPRVDADGNDLGGVPSVLLQAPLGTYADWNVTAAGYYKGAVCGLNGAYIPFAPTKAERIAKGDPRLSLEERYGSHAAYVQAVRGAAAKAVAGRFLLQEDADKLIAQATASSVLAEK